MARKKKKRRSFPEPKAGPSKASPSKAAQNKAAAKKQSGQSAGPKDASGKPKRKPGQPIRETVESLVVAIVLAFLFRAFQAEAFVIPTGSMAPTLMGRHKDVVCPQSGERFKVNDALAGREFDEIAGQVGRYVPESQVRRMSGPQLRGAAESVQGVSPSCRYPMAMSSEPGRPLLSLDPDTKNQPAYAGDRILVNKYLYDFTEPKRWDVVVFKYPGDATQNYIKRLVGLPEEELRIYQGDLFVRPAGTTQPHRIARKPERTLLAMRQLVHDTDHDSAALNSAGWPLRWRDDGPGAGWSTEAVDAGGRRRQSHRVKASGATRWLRYRHTPAPTQAWRAALAPKNPPPLPTATPSLITDYNAYNSEVIRAGIQTTGLGLQPTAAGLHWVGDLMVEADVRVESASGELLLDLVEAGRHFTCTIDLATGRATLSIRGFGDAAPGSADSGDEGPTNGGWAGGPPLDGFAATAETPIRKPGDYRLRFSNFDDQLLLWVNDSAVSFDAETVYDADAVFGDRDAATPQTDPTGDPGDLAPVGVGARGAELTVTRLRVWRDLYYIADSWRNQRYRGQNAVTDFPLERPSGLFQSTLRVRTKSGGVPLFALPSQPSTWSAFRERRREDFATQADQFFVMGDNSASSLDCRLWRGSSGAGQPGGPYLERSLLIGKAVCVYWPHSWFYLAPNIADMRLVR
ncbi:MAG: signal peptidase I [Planctomycetota bacterium]